MRSDHLAGQFIAIAAVIALIGATLGFIIGNAVGFTTANYKIGKANREQAAYVADLQSQLAKANAKEAEVIVKEKTKRVYVRLKQAQTKLDEIKLECKPEDEAAAVAAYLAARDIVRSEASASASDRPASGTP